MFSLSSQLFAFGVTVCGGLFLGLLFDIYRALRGVIRPKKFITHLGDLMFWIICTVLIFVILLLGNWGEVRAYVFIGLVLGTLLYIKMLSTTVMRVILVLIKVVRTIKLEIVKLVLFLYRVIRYPIDLVHKVVLIPVGLIGGFLISTKQILRKFLGTLRQRFVKPPPSE